MAAASAPIFIVGAPRSGTTLLRCMMNAHPRIYIAHEASFYSWERLFPRNASGRAIVDSYFLTHSFRWLRVDAAQVLSAFPDSLPREQVGQVFAAALQAKAAQYGRERFGDKTPAHTHSLGRIFADFPGARVIHIVRDPRATAFSLSRMPWGSPSLYDCAVACAHDWRVAARFRDKTLQVRLEDLLAEPRQTMGRVLDFVGEPWDEAVLDHARHLPDPHDMAPLPWLETALRERAATRAQWASLPAAEIRMIERLTVRTMKEAGYSPAVLEKEPSTLAVWWNGLKQVPGWFRRGFIFLSLARQLRDPRNYYGPQVAELFRRLNPEAAAKFPDFIKLQAVPALQSHATTAQSSVASR